VQPFLNAKEVTERIMTVIKNFEKVFLSVYFFSIDSFLLQVNASKVSATARFKEDLDLDSLDAVEVVMAIEEEFGIEIPDSEADKIHSVADAVSYIAAHPMAK
jgi:NADH dehydrogenase (ubiquinone) 1 alpha/beta subcomplex 1